MEMSINEVKAILHANEGHRLRITFADDVAQSVDINAVDQDGFLHSGPEGAGQAYWWTRYEDVKFIDCINVD
jgi:hypothetical protein